MMSMFRFSKNMLRNITFPNLAILSHRVRRRMVRVRVSPHREVAWPVVVDHSGVVDPMEVLPPGGDHSVDVEAGDRREICTQSMAIRYVEHFWESHFLALPKLLLILELR